MHLKFSVVIPTCDRPDYLVEAVASVLRQCLPPTEVLVIDNGITPVPPQRLPADSRLRLVRALPRCGVSQARNLGAVLAQGSHLAFLDDDDQWEPQYLAAVAAVFRATGADVVLGSRKHLQTGAVIADKSVPIQAQAPFLRTLLMRNAGAGGSAICTRRAVFFQSAGFDPSLTTGEDRALVVDLMLGGATVARAADAWMLFRTGGQGERLNSLARLCQGKRRFLGKYWAHYRWRERLWLLAQYLRLLLRAQLLRLARSQTLFR